MYYFIYIAFGKARSFRNDDPDECQVFEVIFPKYVRRAFQHEYKSKFIGKLSQKGIDPSSWLSAPLPDNLNETDYE